MFDTILSRIYEAIHWSMSDSNGLSTDFYYRVKAIRQDLLVMYKTNVTECQDFLRQNEEAFRQLDEKIITYEKQHETTISQLMSGQSQLSDEALEEALQSKETFIELYRSLYFAERRLLTKDPQHLCHVGCGPMPASILMWMKYTAANITAIDFDGQAIACAKVVFEQWRHTKNIPADRANFLTLPGEEVDYRNMDVIVISASILNKENVYAAILATANREVTVIERTPNFLYNQAFTTPAGFEAFRLGGEARDNVNLQSYQFTPLSGVTHGK
ncbi:hypothetical protein WKG86_10195 [Pantoea agglomerans]|uniref:Pyridine nucleotide-disulphide oxidoreductase n=2 Tax=Enterobacter agglomerans TaxID=549 RepID=A0A7T8CLY0_ENTAG|nr:MULTISPECIES: hypothetical protein [Pantoea]KAF6674854.1 hypothetical protein HFD87_16105 [Pantoea sp. EKM21T]KAF6682419.1 hypothetical protein HFD90_10970 [Pantoea sp. EKM22T]MBD8127991.1 hypothetical protein [Pantoea agglomerans]MBD8155755.1 hypothetical protein [Pantoea agglomerans]MBD8197390.1 hypothetical protein [Pantoea agglomerans]